MNDPSSPGRVTLKEIACAVGISCSGVSLALRDSPRIGLAMRERVKAAALEMGYQPNAAAASLAQFRRTSSVKPVHAALAWLNFWPNANELRNRKEFDHYWIGAKASAQKFGYRLEEFVCNKDMPLSRIEKILNARGIQGIFLPPHLSTPDWGNFSWDRFSVVRFGRTISAPEFHVVTADQVANTALAFKKMRDFGYERIGLIEDHKSQRYGRLFKAGFLLAQSEMERQSTIPVFSMSEQAPAETNVPALSQWLKEVKPDALLTDTHKATKLLALCGCRIPEKVGLAATSVLDGEADAGIYQNSEEIGRVAMLALITLIQDKDRGVPKLHREILVKGSWVDGKSLPRREVICP